MKMVYALDCGSAESLGSQLTSALTIFCGNAESQDDETIIVIRKE
jgi:hypothetical protein